MVRFALALSSVLMLIAAPASAEPEILDADYGSADRGSVYRNFGYKTFVRGGVGFSDINPDTTVESPYGTIGGSMPVYTSGRFRVSAEGEFYAQRSQTDVLNPAGALLAEYRRWTFAALFGARAEYALTGKVAPFVSFAAGPAYLDSVAQILDEEEMVLFDGISSSVQVAYSGRTGVSFYLGEGVGIEAAYRYLGVTTNPSEGLHSGELGLSFEF